MVVDQLAIGNTTKFASHKSRTEVAAYKLGLGVDAHSIILAKSKSYMNESGGPIKALAQFYSVNPDHMIVLHDELDIPFSAIRAKFGGGDNGHNGLKSLTTAFETGDFFRVRLGIGRPIGSQDPGDFVLKQFSSAEKRDLVDFLTRGAEVVESLIEKGLDITQSRYNS